MATEEAKIENSLSGYERELAFVQEIADRSEALALKYFLGAAEMELVSKEDGSPVTRADKEVERLIRDELAFRFPADQILGEEESSDDTDAVSSKAPHPQGGRKWIVDPIDGTFNFARGIPIWSTLIALEDKGEIVLGLVNAPAMNERFHAVRGQGAFKNGKRIFVSAVDKIEESLFNFGGPNRIVKKGLWPALTRVVEVSYRQRGFGDYLGFSLVFEGKAEAMLEVDVKPWDLAPMKIIVEEAGGVFTDLAGGASVYNGSCLITNKSLAHQYKKFFID
jgi:histidinol-phosphatase